MQVIFFFTMISFVCNLGQANDCYEPDMCTCLAKVILCENIFGEPHVWVSDADMIEKFYLSSSLITSLAFMDSFRNLKLLSIYEDVRINCTLVYTKRTTTSVHIDVNQCAGMLYFG